MTPSQHALRTTSIVEEPKHRTLAVGELMRDARQLTEDQIKQVLAYQREKRLRFGEAAVALRLADRMHVIEALSRQFRYPYTPSFAHYANRELVMVADPFGEQAEAFRDLRSELLMEVLGPPNRALAVLSHDIGDGKTYVAANLALAFSQLGRRTLLVDADLRGPRQHRIFGIEHETGLSTVLSGRSAGNVVHQLAQLPGLYLLAAGPLPPNPLELLHRSDFDGLMAEMLHNFDHVVVDTPAAVRGADGRLIAAKSGAALVIGRRGYTRLTDLQSLLVLLEKGPAKVAGLLMNEH